jgi:hypothetical protein
MLLAEPPDARGSRIGRRRRPCRVPGGSDRQYGPVVDLRRGIGVVAAVTAAVGVALAVGFHNAGRSYSYDEAVTVSHFVWYGDPIHALTTQVVFNNHPPLSAIQALTWRAGLTTEATQRITPVLFGTAAIGVIAAWLTRRYGWLAGVAGALTLTLNPMFLTYLRSVRGYSLAVLGVVVAAVCLDRWLGGDRRTRWLMLQGVAMAVAVATHVYSAVPMLMMAAAILAARRLERPLVVTWALAAAAAVGAQLLVLAQTLEASRTRGQRFQADFPRQVATELLGRATPAVAVIGVIATIGTVAVMRNSPVAARAVLAALVTGGVLVAAVWLIARPHDLYPRFFVSLTPLVAVAVGRGVAALPPLAAAPAAVLAVTTLWFPAATELAREPTIERAAEVVDAGRRLGQRPCGVNILPLRVYTETPALVTSPADLADCDLVVVLGRAAGDLADAANERYGTSWNLGGGIGVYSVVDIDTLNAEITEPSN